MRWTVLAPFAHTAHLGWIPAEVDVPGQTLAVCPARYHHDRSRPGTSGRQWLDYLFHAARGWFAPGGGDGLVTWFPQLAASAGLLKRLTFSRRPIIAWCFNLGQTFDGGKGRLARFALAGVDLFVVHSRREADVYARWLGLPEERFIYVPLSVETPPASAADPEEEPFVLAMGSAHRDYRALVAAMGALSHRTIIVAGPHTLDGLVLPPNVETRSGLTIEACHDLARRARVNVVPIDNQTTASGQVTVIEAMMLGRAVVATRCAGTEDYLEDGITGLLVPPHDSAALGAAIERLWSDAALRRRIGCAAREAAMANYTFAAAAPRLSDMLATLDRRS